MSFYLFIYKLIYLMTSGRQYFRVLDLPLILIGTNSNHSNQGKEILCVIFDREMCNFINKFF